MKRLLKVLLLFILITSCKGDPRNIIVEDIKTPCESVSKINEIYKEMISLRNGRDLKSFMKNRDSEDFKKFLELHNKAEEIKKLTEERDYSTYELQACPELNEMMENYRRAEDN